MAKRPTTTDITNVLNSASRINANYDAIEAAFDNTISRDGSTPNQMAADFDLNGNDILNAASIAATTIVLNGEEIVVNSLVSRATLIAAVAAAEAARDTAVTANTNAQSAATAAATSATASANSATSAASSVTAATTQATLATAQATAAATSATAAGNSATSASTSATNAATSATNASTSASGASTSATNAANSATAAATSATNAAASFDSFDDRYLGSKSANPTTDNDGNALLTGALYWNTTDDEMRVYNGSSWQAVAPMATGALLISNNLSDLNSASTARTNLGLGSLATQNSISAATTSASGVVELATTAEGNTGTDTSRVTSVAVVHSMIDTHGSSGGGTETLLSRQSLSGNSTAAFTSALFDSSTYDGYVFRFYDLRCSSSGRIFRIRTTDNGGTSYDAGLGNYAYSGTIARSNNTVTAQGNNSSSSAFLTSTTSGQGIGTDSGDGGLSGELFLPNPHSTVNTRIQSRITYRSSGNELITAVMDCERLQAALVNAVQFSYSSGNMTGVITMSGIGNS